MQYSVVVPIYNESKRLPKYFPVLVDILDKTLVNYEVIIVDDGSKDNTVEIVNQLISNKIDKIKFLKLKPNRGKGRAIGEGIKICRGEYIFYTDADLSVDLEKALPLAIGELKAYDIVIASRRLEKSKILVHQNQMRELLGSLYTSLANFILNTNHSDLTCGFKGFKKQTAIDLFANLECERWSYDAEILYKASLKRYKTTEIPVDWKNDFGTKVNLKTDILSSFIDLIKIRFSH